MTATDLFGPLPIGAKPQGAKAAKQRGYAAPPGTGPAGETCKSCRHYVLRQFAGTYRKCGLMRRFWTGGPGSDVRASAPACSRWEKPNEKAPD